MTSNNKWIFRPYENKPAMKFFSSRSQPRRFASSLTLKPQLESTLLALNWTSSRVNWRSVEHRTRTSHDSGIDNRTRKGIRHEREELWNNDCDTAQRKRHDAARPCPEDLSFPDISSLPKLAEELGVTVDELLKAKAEKPERESTTQKVRPLIELVFKAVALAMGVGVTALTIIDEVKPNDAFRLLGIGLACLAIVQIAHHQDEEA